MAAASVVALIVAAGRGIRAGGGLPKQYRALSQAPLLRHTILRFLETPLVDHVRVVIHPDDMDLYRDAVKDLSALEPCFGGSTRQQSVLNGLRSFSEARPDRVLIHDAARPFVDEALIGRVIEALDDHSAAIPATAVRDTLKRGSDGLINETVDRTGLWGAQTPQGFHYQAIFKAHEAAQGQELTDDAAVAEAAAIEVALVEGDPDNIKVTEPRDFQMAEALMSMGKQSDLLTEEMRTGHGFDVHRFESGDAAILCGVTIPHTHKLAGHSDADVGLHALTDAILGAIGAGDIGDHFPPSDPKWKGASSDRFLAHAGELVSQANGRLVNVDVTLICEAPKIGPHRTAMRESVAKILNIDPNRVSVKATTTERLGFTGRGEGIAAQASASVAMPRTS